MSDWMIFAERLSEQIKKQNLSIRQLAERMDMTPTTIFRYAKGQRVPRASEILKASDALGVTCDYLIGLSDDPKKASRSSAQPERWIPCSERLPNDNDYNSCMECIDGAVWYFTEKGAMGLGYYYESTKQWATTDDLKTDGKVVAWMPLPEPYKEADR